jgi:hypothetical protein
MIAGAAILAGVFVVDLKSPGRVGEDDAVDLATEFLRGCDGCRG